MVWMLLLGVRHLQHRPAGRRELRHGHRRLWLRRLLRRLRMQRRNLEPEGKVAGRAALARVGIGLGLAFARARRALDADVEVVVVTVHRPDLVEPAAVALDLAAQRLLDRGIDEDALYARFLRRGANDNQMTWREHARIDVQFIL